MQFTQLLIFLGLVCLSYSNNITNSSNVRTKKIGKRLETVEGVEIASSYKEYMDLALSDLEDRLNKSRLKLKDFNDRIGKRSVLLNEIKNEIERCKELAKNYTEKDKELRARLLRNTEMKSAITNLADIAEYKLSNRHLKNDFLVKENISIPRNKTFKRKELNHTFIELAYNEINGILTLDKQTLVNIIRKKLTNDYKLKELEKLKIEVSDSLKKLENYKHRLNQLIAHDNDVDDILRQLKNRNKLEPDEKKKILSIIGFFPKNEVKVN